MSLSAFYEAMAAKARRSEAKDDARQTAGRPRTTAQREAERAELRRDMAEGAAMAREYAAQQAAEADPDAAYRAHCKRQALLIVQAGARARGLPVPTRLVQDQSPEYPDDSNGPAKDNTDGDDTSDPPKEKRKTKKKIKDEDENIDAEDDEDAEDKPSKPLDRGHEDENTAPDEKNKAIALQIINAGRRRRNLPLLTRLEQDR